jgi:hypothetical protein
MAQKFGCNVSTRENVIFGFQSLDRKKLSSTLKMEAAGSFKT